MSLDTLPEQQPILGQTSDTILQGIDSSTSVTHVDMQLQTTQTGLQNWLKRFVDNHTPDEIGLSVFLPSAFKVDKALVRTGVGNTIHLVSFDQGPDKPQVLATIVQTL